MSRFRSCAGVRSSWSPATVERKLSSGAGGRPQAPPPAALSAPPLVATWREAGDTYRLSPPSRVRVGFRAGRRRLDPAAVNQHEAWLEAGEGDWSGWPGW